MTRKTPANIDPDTIVDQLYDIALDPGSLESFIEAWNNAGLDTQSARQTLEGIDTFDEAYKSHLRRAETFLNRGEDAGPSLAETLAPFKNLAALIVDRAFDVIACNDGARMSFGIAEGATLSDMTLPEDARIRCQRALADLFSDGVQHSDRLVKLEMGETERPTLFQIRRLSDVSDGGPGLALIVSTQYHWLPALGQTLEEVFKLTAAELGVVRALVEGRDAKTVAQERGTSEGTVRSQIKSILAKMNAKSQSEVIRLVLSLRDVTSFSPADATPEDPRPARVLKDWLDAEVWKPFRTLTLPDGRRMDYHDMGPVTGTPILYSHMGYAMTRWSRPMLKHAFQQGLRIICPIRAGYGSSDNLNLNDDLLRCTRDDTLFLLETLGISKLPYVAQGSDLIFAIDLAAEHPEAISEIIGICARPYLPGDAHYVNLGKWHRFFLSTAKHAPHLLNFTSKAAFAMARRITVTEMYRHMQKSSPADLALLNDDEHVPVMLANATMIVGTDQNASQAYAMELLATETDWSGQIIKAKKTPTRFINGIEDPAQDTASLADYREVYPWIPIEVLQNAGQMLMYQHYDTVIPQLCKAARNASTA